MKRKELTRREFVRLTSMGLTGGCALLSGGEALARMGMSGTTTTGMMGGGMGGGGMGGGVIDPPVSGPFVDPPEMLASRKIVDRVEYVTVNLEAKTSLIRVNGTNASLMTYNGSYPGPTIRLKPGSVLRVNLKNSLPRTTAKNLLGFTKNVTNLHAHGFHVSPKGPPERVPASDYVIYALPPGGTYVHEYDTALHPPGTLSFYHPHKHGVVAEQFWAGLAGALLVEDPDTSLSQYEQHLLILKDISLSGSSPAPHSTMSDYMQGKEGSVVMVNGRVNPRLPIRKGQVQRWRVLNASGARFYRLALEGGGIFHVIGTDGGLLDRPYPVSELLLSPGERADVLVQGWSAGDYRLFALPYARMGMMTSPQITLMTLSCSGSQVQNLPEVVDEKAVRIDPSSVQISGVRNLELSMGMGRGYINGQDFDVDPYTISSDLGTYEIWTVVNRSGMDHPFHQHVNHAQVLSISGGNAAYRELYTSAPAWKDVVLVPRMGSVTLLVPVMDYPGMTMFHCHILEHEDIGMMGMWDIMGDDM